MPKKSWQVARIRTEEDYKSGGNSDYISLDEGENFVGYFLGDADEKIDDPAFYPYKIHWINGSGIPCPGPEVCPYCEQGEKPRAKAMTLWLVTRNARGDKNDDGEVMIWDMPVSVIRALRDFKSEDEIIKGRLFRVGRPEEKQYNLLPKSDTLKATAIKTALKDGPDFEEMLNSKLRKAMEGVALARAMEDDDDDETEDEAPKRGRSAKGKSSANSRTKEEPDEWPEDGVEEATVVVVKKDRNGNWIEVESDDYEGTAKVWVSDDIEFDLTELSKGDEVVITTGEQDDDGEYVMTEEPVVEEPEAEPEEEEEEEEEGADNNLPESLEDIEFEITEIDTANQTIDVSNEDYTFTLFFLDKGPASKVDFDDYEVGNKITFSAEKDSVGDMVATSIPEVAKTRTRRAPARKSSGTTRKAAPKTATRKTATSRTSTRKTGTAKSKTATRRTTRK